MTTVFVVACLPRRSTPPFSCVLVPGCHRFVARAVLLQGEITEGSESEIRAAFFVFAVTREVEPDSGNLIWRAVEMSMQGSMLYL